MRLTLSSLVISSCTLLAACQDPLAQQRRQLAAAQATEATAALKKGEYARASYAAELAAQYDPLDPALRDLTLRVSLGQIAATRPSLTKDQFGRAAYQSEVLTGRDPANRHIYDTVRAIDAFARGDSAGAEKGLRDVTTASPGYVPAWLMLGDVLQASRRPKDALVAFETAAGLDKFNARAASNLGMIYAQLGNPTAAVEKLSQALNLEDTAGVRATLASAFLSLDRPMDALPHIATATRLEPRDGRYRVTLGEVQLKLDLLEEAGAAFRDAAALGAEPWASRGLGAVAMKKKDYATASQSFARVLAMSPDELSTIFLAAEAQEGLAHPRDAAKLYARFAELAERIPSEAPRLLLAKDRLARLGPAPK
ncbi:MAG: tetratricopeptide repeat protein [Archangium sp.]|nr:tetratricopeptide repeat protein [Archangium sp.]